jgi:hypothetical protein
MRKSAYTENRPRLRRPNSTGRGNGRTPLTGFVAKWAKGAPRARTVGTAQTKSLSRGESGLIEFGAPSNAQVVGGEFVPQDPRTRPPPTLIILNYHERVRDGKKKVKKWRISLLATRKLVVFDHSPNC